MKIYDCFTFYNEFELLELRLEALYDTVDCFVIVEANRTHTNKPKEYNFLARQNDFRKYFPKLRYVKHVPNVEYKGVGDWSIENGQRNAIMSGIQDAQPDDLIFISDLDEIPAPDVVDRILNNRQKITFTFYVPGVKYNGASVPIPSLALVPSASLLEVCPIAMEQQLHYYYLNMKSRLPWNGSILVKRKNLTTPQALRDIRNYLPHATEGGRHFSYMGGVDRVIDKMTSIVDGNEEVVKSEGKFIDRKHVEKFMRDGTDPYERDVWWKVECFPCELEEIKLPGLAEFVKKYPHFVRR